MNKLLQDQLREHFANANEMPGDFKRLLDVISDSYDRYESDVTGKERSFDINLQGVTELNTRLTIEREDINNAHKELKTLFEDINEVLYSVDIISNKLTQISPVCEKVYGYTAAEFFADDNLWQKIIYPEDIHIAEQHVQLLFGGKQVINQYRIIHKDKSLRWVENKIIPTLDETGSLVRIGGVTSDISERKRAEKELEKSISILEATIESTADGILVADLNGKMICFNKKFVELWRLPADILDTRDDEKAIAFVLGQLINPEASLSRIKELYIRREDVSFDILKFKDGRTVERYSQPQLINGDCVGRVWSFRDITQRTKAEETSILLSDMISNTSDAIIIRDPLTDHIIFWNEGAEKLYGYNKNEAIGISKEVLVQTRFPFSLNAIINAFDKDGFWTGELIQTSKSGGIVHVETSWTLRKNAMGTPVGILEINRNITEKKNAEAALIKSDGQLTLATQIARLGYWEFDVLNGLFTFSDEFYAIFKTSAQKTGGYTMTPERYAGLFVFPDDRAVVGMEVGNAINSTDPHFSRQIEHRIMYATGEIGWISVRFHIIKDNEGRTIKTFGVNQDITGRKNAEETLRRSEVNLEIKNKQLEQKNIELEQFAYIASHDLQEPLRTTSGFIKLLHKQYQGNSDPKSDKYFAYILEASERMRLLIKNLLDYSRIGNKKEPEQVDCNKVLQNVLADLGTAISETGASIDYDTLPVVNGYTTELKQLFQNLIINAIKFRKKEIAPLINISVEKNEGHWQFAFKDNGIGIAPINSEKIFVIFQRLHTQTEYEGSGIGLSHCKKIVELHRGRIWVESRPGEGSTFQFTIAADN